MFIVMGLPGVGKSTVLQAVVDKRKDYRILNYGTLMFDIAKRKFEISQRDSLRKLDHIEQKAIQAEVGNDLAKMSGKIILDTHCSISTPNGYLVGLPDELLKKLKNNVELLVYINAPIREIISRRSKDATRVRDADSEKALKDHDDYNIRLLHHYKEVSGAEYKIISNRDGGLEKAQQELLSFLK